MVERKALSVSVSRALLSGQWNGKRHAGRTQQIWVHAVLQPIRRMTYHDDTETYKIYGLSYEAQLKVVAESLETKLGTEIDAETNVMLKITDN